jgi:hypothetical protein
VVLICPPRSLGLPQPSKLWSHGETGYHSLAAAVVKEREKREGMASAFRILGEGQLALTKSLLLLRSAFEAEGSGSAAA